MNIRALTRRIPGRIPGGIPGRIPGRIPGLDPARQTTDLAVLNPPSARLREIASWPTIEGVPRLTIPAWMAGDVSDTELEASDVMGDGSVIEFSYGGAQYIYDRLGLRRTP